MLPGNGAVVNGMVLVSGAANIENFDYYKFEFRFPDGSWNYLNHFTAPVDDGVLGQWNSDVLPPGQIEFRLVVVDKIGNYPEPCVVSLTVR